MSNALKPELFDWSAEQRAVIESDAANLVVTASAGAGKTRVLVERYLRHVSEGYAPDQILTITFTKKAAAEMKRRIVEALTRLGLEDDAQIAETGPIQTIHSFCERLLRENALEAGLDPKFEILSSAQTDHLVAECMRGALAEEPDVDAAADDDLPLENVNYSLELMTFLAGVSRRNGRTSGGPYSRLEGAVSGVLSAMRSSGRRQEEFRAWYANPEALESFERGCILGTAPESVQRAYEDLPASSFAERLKASYQAAGVSVPAWLRSRDDPAGLALDRIHTCGLVQLAVGAWWRYEREMTHRQSLDFTALEARAVRLLENSEQTRRRLTHQFPIVMVDEAQDVNPVQYRLLDQLGAERKMMVGDTQQSIFGFRQADVDLFRGRIDSATCQSLSRNFRSKPGILRFVDLVFANRWRDRYRPMGEQPIAIDFETDDMGPSSGPSSGGGFEGVEFWTNGPKDNDAVPEFVGQLLTEGVAPNEIAILVRRGLEAIEIKDALARYGIESRIAGGSERFYTRLEVRDLANALRAVADPHDDFAVLACLRSPMAGLSLDSIVMLGSEPGVADRLPDFIPPIPEDEKRLRGFLAWYPTLRSYGDRLSAWEVLSEIFAHSDYLPALARRPEADQLLANVRKLLVLATEEPELGPLEYAERIRDIRELSHREGDAPVTADEHRLVNIMTVHKSKGLEFEVVIVPQTDFKLESRAKDVVVEPRLGLVATKFSSTHSVTYRFLEARRKKKEFEEEWRLYYVALTRAKSRLCLCLNPKPAFESFAKEIRTLFPGPPPGVVVRERAVESET